MAAAPPSAFVLGEAVEVVDDGGRWHKATIVKVHANGYYDINGELEVGPERLRAATTSLSSSLSGLCV